VRVLITNVSDTECLGWIKCLKRIEGIEIFGTDQIPLGYSLGSLLVDYYFDLPAELYGEEYIAYIDSLCKRLHIDVLISVTDGELELVIKYVSKDGVLEKCANEECSLLHYRKYEEAMKLNETSVKAPELLNSLFNREGIGEIAVTSTDNVSLEYLSVNNRLIQRNYKEEYFIVDVLTDKNGKMVLCIPRKQMDMRLGYSPVCQLIYDVDIIKVCERIYSKYRIPGVSNVHFVKNRYGLYFVEVNPRLDETAVADAICGVNIVELFSQHFLQDKSLKRMDEYFNEIKWNTIVCKDYEEYSYR